MKPTGYKIVHINSVPFVCLDADPDIDGVVFALEDAEKVMRWIAEAIDKVKGDEQVRKFREHLDRAAKQVDAMPEWKRNLLGCIVSQQPKTNHDDPDYKRYSYWPGGDK